MARIPQALALLMSGLLLILLPGSSTPTNALKGQTRVPAISEPKAFLTPEALESAGLFNPLTEEYLRQQTKEVPYSSENPKEPPAPERIEVFKRRSPLELALLPEESASPKKKKARRLPLLGSKGRKKEWEPLSEEEQEAWKREMTKKALEMGSELAESLSMPYFSDGILWTAQRVNAYRRYLANQYRLHVKLSGRDASLSYDVEY